MEVFTGLPDQNQRFASITNPKKKNKGQTDYPPGLVSSSVQSGPVRPSTHWQLHTPSLCFTKPSFWQVGGLEQSPTGTKSGLFFYLLPTETENIPIMFSVKMLSWTMFLWTMFANGTWINNLSFSTWYQIGMVKIQNKTSTASLHSYLKINKIYNTGYMWLKCYRYM